MYDPQAMHLCVVEIDQDTGEPKLLKYFTADDCCVDPMIVEGQVHGGLAQGIGQALMENMVYDDESGRLTSGSFMDYAMPRADCMLPLESTFIRSPAPSNPLGSDALQNSWLHVGAQGTHDRLRNGHACLDWPVLPIGSEQTQATCIRDARTNPSRLQPPSVSER